MRNTPLFLLAYSTTLSGPSPNSEMPPRTPGEYLAHEKSRRGRDRPRPNTHHEWCTFAVTVERSFFGGKRRTEITKRISVYFHILFPFFWIHSPAFQSAGRAAANKRTRASTCNKNGIELHSADGPMGRLRDWTNSTGANTPAIVRYKTRTLDQHVTRGGQRRAMRRRPRPRSPTVQYQPTPSHCPSPLDRRTKRAMLRRGRVPLTRKFSPSSEGAHAHTQRLVTCVEHVPGLTCVKHVPERASR